MGSGLKCSCWHWPGPVLMGFPHPISANAKNVPVTAFCRMEEMIEASGYLVTFPESPRGRGEQDLEPVWNQHPCPCLSSDLPGCRGDVSRWGKGKLQLLQVFTQSHILREAFPMFYTKLHPPHHPLATSSAFLFFISLSSIWLTYSLSTSAPTPPEHKLQEGSLFVSALHCHLSCS